MKQLLTLFALLFMTISIASAQDELIVEPGEPGILEQTIFADTSDTGERNPNRVYVLRRGTPYLLAQRIRWADYHISIKAEEGEGARPLLVFSPDAGGDGVGQLFRTDGSASLSLDGVHLAGRDLLGNTVSQAIRIGGDGVTVRVNDCVITDVGQSVLRFNADNINAYFTNSVINRAGQPTNPNNGRFLDTRGNPVDTVWVENCVVYDITSRIYRSDNGDMNYGVFNQNTFFGSGQEGFTFSTANNLKFTNNVVADPVFLGQTDSTLRYAMTMDTFISGAHNVDISFNNIFVSDAFEAALPDTRASGDSLYSIRNTLFGPNISAAIAESASSTTNISEMLEFANAPEVPTQFIEADAADTSSSSNRIVEDAGDWDFSDLTPDPTYSGLGTGIDRYVEFHDFSYPEGTISFTAGSDGQKLGADLTNLGTDVEEDYFVSANILYYPNPVQEELFIQNLDPVELRSVTLYDIQGHAIRRQPVNGLFARLQLGDLPAGTYVLTIRDHVGKLSSRKITKR